MKIYIPMNVIGIEMNKILMNPTKYTVGEYACLSLNITYTGGDI